MAHGPARPGLYPGLCFSIHLFSVSARPPQCAVQCSRTANGQRLAALFGRGQRAKTQQLPLDGNGCFLQPPRLVGLLPCVALARRPAGSGQHAVGRSNGQEPPQVSIYLSIIVRSGRTHARHEPCPPPASQCSSVQRGSCDSGF